MNEAKCGECESFPCLCPRVDDADICWLGRREGGFQAVPDTQDTPSRRGRYERTEAIRAKNRAHARPGMPCIDGCTCGKHRSQAGRPGRKCPLGCMCGRHLRTPQHNARIGISVALTREATRYARR